MNFSERFSLRRRAWWWLWAVFWMVCSTHAAESAEWRLSVQVDHHVDGVPLRSLGNDTRVAHALPASPTSGRAYVDDDVRISRVAGDWTWSLLSRAYAQASVNGDALDVFARVQLGLRPSEDRAWQAAARFRSYQGSGIGVAYASSDRDSWSLGADVLQLDRWRQQDLVGRLSYQAMSQTFALQGATTRRDDRLTFPFMSPVAPGGWGLLFRGHWALTEGPWHAEIEARDLGWLLWSSLPRQVQTLNTATQSYDANGYLVYAPAISGRYEQGSARLGMIGQWRFGARWEAEPGGVQWGGGLRWLPDLGVWPWIGVSRPAPWGRLGARWDFAQQRFTVSAQGAHWELAVGSDRWAPSARSEILQFRVTKSF